MSQCASGQSLTGQRVVFWVQHLLGTGHLRRAVRVANGMARAGAHVHLLTGGLPTHMEADGITVHQLPPVRCQLGDFKTLRHGDGRPVDDDFKQQRADGVIDLLEQIQPTVLMFEQFPFGRRQMRFEVMPMLDWAARQPQPPMTVASIRDIVVQNKNPTRLVWTTDLIHDHFHKVLVHGDQAFIPFDASFPAVKAIEDKIAYTGYVTVRDAAVCRSAPLDDYAPILVSVGGGAVGADVVSLGLDAAKRDYELGMTHRPWRIFVGRNDPFFCAYQAQATPNVRVEETRDDFVDVLGSAALSISQCGYNTAVELLSLNIPAIFVPFETADETEQRQRAEALADRHWAGCVPAADATAERLLDEIVYRLKTPPDPLGLNMRGVENTVHQLALAVGTYAMTHQVGEQEA